jgi:hypothetical protein
MLLKRFWSNETGNFPKAELLCQVLNLDKQHLQFAESTFVTIVAARKIAELASHATECCDNAVLQLYRDRSSLDVVERNLSFAPGAGK